MTPLMTNVFLLLGTIIGAGIFSLSAALKASGILMFVGLLFFLSALLGYVNWFYYQIIDTSGTKHQLAGYARQILGRPSARLATILLFSSTVGALLAYLIIGGGFMANALHLPAGGGSMVFYGVIFVLILIAGQKVFLWDIAFVVIKLLLIALVIIISFVNRGWMQQPIPMTGPEPLSVYGAILFSLTGFSIIPELRKGHHVRQAIGIAQGLVSAVYLLFAVGLYPYLSSGKFQIDNILFDTMGVFAILTPYLMLTWVGYDMLHNDFRFSKRSALLVMLLLPLLLYVIGLQSFLQVVSVTGGVFSGAIVFLIARMYQKKFPGKHQIIVFLIQAVFGLGILVELWQFFTP